MAAKPRGTGSKVCTVPAPDRPAALLAAVVVTGIEAAGFVVYAAVIVVRGFAGDASSPLNVALLAAVVLLWAGGLVVAARGLLAGRRWARSPLIVAQLLLLAVAVPLVQGAGRLAGWPILVCSVLALGALLSPPVTRALAGAGD
jgi:hypothetical protein